MDTYELDALLVPTTHLTARPIDDVEPYTTINGRKVRNPSIVVSFYSHQTFSAKA